MTNIFEQASRLKFRYETTKGKFNTEDLWELSLEDLDTIAKGLHKVLESNSVSFIRKQDTGSKRLQTQLDVVISVINTKLQEEENRKLATERKAKRERLMELIAQKEDTSMARKSISALKADLDKLDEEAESD